MGAVGAVGALGAVGRQRLCSFPRGAGSLEGEIGALVHKTSLPQAMSAMGNPDGEQNNYPSNSGKPAVDERLKETWSVSFVNPGVRAAWGSQKTWLWKTSTLACVCNLRQTLKFPIVFNPHRGYVCFIKWILREREDGGMWRKKHCG